MAKSKKKLSKEEKLFLREFEKISGVNKKKSKPKIETKKEVAKRELQIEKQLFKLAKIERPRFKGKFIKRDLAEFIEGGALEEGLTFEAYAKKYEKEIADFRDNKYVQVSYQIDDLITAINLHPDKKVIIKGSPYPITKLELIKILSDFKRSILNKHKGKIYNIVFDKSLIRMYTDTKKISVDISDIESALSAETDELLNQEFDIKFYGSEGGKETKKARKSKVEKRIKEINKK